MRDTNDSTIKTTDVNGWKISFDPIRHVYFDSLGKIPGVSEIIASGKANKFYSKDTTKRDRGTRIHEATAMMDTIGLSPLDFDEIDIHPHLTAWNNWQFESGAKILSVEKLVGHGELRYAGTLDRVCCVNGLMVVDLKTGAHVAWHKHQLAAYAVALEWETGILPMGGIAVYTKDSGKYTTKPYQDTAWKDAIYEWKEMVQKYKEKIS